MRKAIYLFIIALIIVAIGVVSCADKMDNNLNQTGLLDQSGNLLTNTLIKTNILSINGDIPAWATNLKVDFVIITNSDNTEIKYEEDVFIPNLPDKPSDYYQIYVPFAGSGENIYTVSYKDTNRLKQLWFDQIQRKGVKDGKVFAIRNKANNRDLNDFQNRHVNGKYSAQDYYYFNENGDIVWKENNQIIKKFCGAIITEYREVEKKFSEKYFVNLTPEIQNDLWPGIIKYTWKQKGIFTVGAVYANAITTEMARMTYLGRRNGQKIYARGDDIFKDGVFEFVAYRYMVETYAGWFEQYFQLCERQYIRPGFVEVLVLNPYDNMGYGYGAGIHSYYAYYGVYNEWINHFNSQNLPYMTNQDIYIANRPERTTPLLANTAAFTDADRGWCFLAMPGHKN